MKIGEQNAGSFVSKDNDTNSKLKDLISEMMKVANHIEKRQSRGPASYIVLPSSLIKPHEDAIDKEGE